MRLPPERRLPAARREYPDAPVELTRDAAEPVGLSLKDYWLIVRRHRWLVAIAGVIGVGLAAALVLREPPRYRATASIQLTEERQRLTGGLDGTAMAASQTWGWGLDGILSQIQVLKSRGVIEQVVTDVGLQLQPLSAELTRSVFQPLHVPDVDRVDTLHLAFAGDGVRVQGRTGESTAAWGEPVEVDGIRFVVLARPSISEAAVIVVPRRYVTQRVMEDLQARQREKTTVVDLEYIATDPVLAQQVVNSTAATFQAFSSRAAQQQSRRRREFVEEQLGNTQILLEEAQLALSRFRERETVYSSREKLAAQQAELMQLDMRRGELDADRRMLTSLLSTLQQGRDGERAPLQTLIASPAVAGSPVVAQLTTQLLLYESALDSLRSGPWASAETNPDVQRLRAQLATTEQRLTDAVQSQLATLTARISALDDLRGRNTAALQLLPSVEAEEVRLAEQVDGIRTVAEQLREELQRARIAEAVEAGPVEILDMAIVPDQPLGRGRIRKLVFGLVLGLMIGGTGAFMLENMNTSIRRREDLEEHLQLAGLAVVPQFAGDRGSMLRRLSDGVQRKALPGRSAARTNGAHLVTIAGRDAAGAEAYRTLRTNLLFSQAARELRQIIVTSAAPGEGKSTTAANLAVSFAQNGLDVLLIDCDLRRPRLHEFFGLQRQPGLTELVLGHATAAHALQATGTEKLTLLTSGTLPPNPSEFLGSVKMRDVLDELKQRFEMVILDTPPLLAAADAAPLGAISDGVVFVIRAGATDRKAALFALRQLDSVGARVLGAVLNDPNAEAEQYGDYHYSSYYAPAPG